MTDALRFPARGGYSDKRHDPVKHMTDALTTAAAKALFVNRYGTRCLKRIASGERVTSMSVSYVMLKQKGLLEKTSFTTGQFKGWRLTLLGMAYCELNDIRIVDHRPAADPAGMAAAQRMRPVGVASQEEYEPHAAPAAPAAPVAPTLLPATEQAALDHWEQQRLAKEAIWVADAAAATHIERNVATVLCQFNRITRDMPSDVEIGRALPQARSLIKHIREAP